MEKFTSITSKVVPLPRRDVDTDLIIPAQFLTTVGRDGFAHTLFRRLRDTEPDFPLNQPRYAGAKILVTGDNFGCGSSREHAVWALRDGGFKVLIGTSFADIFSSNSSKNGLLLVVLGQEAVDMLLDLAQREDVEVTVDLERQVVVVPGGREIHFEYDSFRKHCLLNGQDDLDYISSHADEIDRFRKNQEQVRFVRTV